MTFPNLLESKPGRMAAFFLLYVCEGLPQGLATAAIALEFKRMQMEATSIATFLALIILPWAWKWLAGPLVDNFRLSRFGPRKQWIIFCQLGMILSLLIALAYFPKSVETLTAFSIILFIHNIFAACQDVSIDALACSTLREHERGTANGLMFAGAQAGAAIGGSGVLFLKGSWGFHTAALIVPACLIAIFITVLLFLKEPPPPTETKKPQQVVRDLGTYITSVFKVFLTTKRGFLGMVLAILPFGGMALSLTVSKVLAPTLGMTDHEIAKLDLISSLVFIVCCMSGGFFSDLWGRRKTLALFTIATLIPTLWMGYRLQQEGWTDPPAGLPDGTWPRHEGLIHSWWLASIAFAVFNGLMYGIRTALFMDIVQPKIAATQFTAYMALMNFTMAYSYWWEGKAITSSAKGGWGFSYFQVFLVDAILGALFLFVLPFVRPLPRKENPALIGETPLP